MRRQKFLIEGLALLAVLGLSACGAGIRQSAAASDDDAGTVHLSQPSQDQATTYTTQAGDTLLSVAARPDIYGDPDLWPLLKDANGESLGSEAPDGKLAADLVLEIPRGSTPEVLDAAREQARQFAAQRKALEAARAAAKLPADARLGSDAHGSAAVAVGAVGSTVVAHALAAVHPSNPVVSPVSTPVPAPAPAHGSRMLPLYLLLALVLAALGAVFYVFFRRDKQDFD